MKYYPVFVRVAERHCVVIGGGAVGQRKVESLLDADAAVTLVSPRATGDLAEMAAAGRVVWHQRLYAKGDLEGAMLAYAATDDEKLNAQLAIDAQQAGVLLNVVDRPQHCSFIVPSILSRGDLGVAVSTSGASPALARRIREEIDRFLGPEYDRALLLLAALRGALHDTQLNPGERQAILQELAGSDLVELLRDPKPEVIDRILSERVAPEITLESLGVRFVG